MRFFSLSDCINNSKHEKNYLGKFALMLTICQKQRKCEKKQVQKFVDLQLVKMEKNNF